LNAISNTPLVAKIILPLLVILTIWLLSGEDDNDIELEQSETHHSSDYDITGFTLSAMDKDGKLSRVISGQKMAHYPEDDSTEIIFPIARFIEPEKDTWIVTADKGHTQGKGEDILLTGNVIITREINDEIELHTEKLHLDTQHNTAYTDTAVTLKSPYGETNGVGMHVVLDDETIDLHSKVKGHYNVPTNN